MSPPTKASSPLNVSAEDCSSELLDLILILNDAKRFKVGDFVWLSWDSYHWNKKKKGSGWRTQTPSAGAHFFALTAEGARFLLNQRVENEFREAHMGTTLAFILRKYQKSFAETGFGCSYINPPIGNYVAHTTTTNANVRDLPSHFDESWCQGGTRKDEKFGWWYHRKLCHITVKGPPEIQLEVVPDVNDLAQWWWTKAPADFPEEFMGPQWWHKRITIPDCM